MNLITPCCRDRLTAEDVEFLMSVLIDGASEREFLIKLLTDTESRDEILDSDCLVDALADSPELTAISPYLYFYLTVRHGFRNAGIEDRDIADYVADILAEFLRRERLVHPLGDQGQALIYLVDILKAAAEADGPGVEFALRSHLGNYALFLSGLYPEAIEKRCQRRGAPGLDFFEEVGSASFRIASQLRLAGEYEIERLLKILGANFRFVRETLNQLALRSMFINSAPRAA